MNGARGRKRQGKRRGGINTGVTTMRKETSVLGKF